MLIRRNRASSHDGLDTVLPLSYLKDALTWLAPSSIPTRISFEFIYEHDSASGDSPSFYDLQTVVSVCGAGRGNANRRQTELRLVFVLTL